MDTERSKVLRDYLQQTLQLSFTFPEPEEDPEFYDNVYTSLKEHHETLCHVLQSAYPGEKSLQQLLKLEWGNFSDEIPHGESYADKLRNTIEWMEAEGYLLEFVAAAHQRKPRNAKLNAFLRRKFVIILNLPVSSQQISQSALPAQSSSPPAKDSGINTNFHDLEISKGSVNSNRTSLQELPSELLKVEADHDNRQFQPTPFPGKIIAIENQLQDEPIASAYTRTRTAREKLQSVYDVFKTGGNISDSQFAESIEQAKNSIEGIDDIFVNIPIPDCFELDYRLAAEEKYICERLSLLAAYALQDASISSPAVFQGADREFNKVFSGFQNLENFIAKFEEQIQLLDRINNASLGNSS